MLTRAYIAIVISLALHFAWMLELPSRIFPHQKASDKITFKVTETSKIKNQMVMAHQEPTQPPEKESRESWEDHRADKPMNPKELAKLNNEKKAEKPFLQQAHSPSSGALGTLSPENVSSAKSSDQNSPQKIVVNEARKKIVVKGTTERNSYEKFLYQTATAISNNTSSKVENDEVGTGDRVDMDTTEYRYMGYFSSMRKAIEMVWIYPSEAARRGIQGTVTLEFRIEKNGSTKNIKILRSSGEKSLDRAIVEAISLAQPFSPLPKGLGKEHLIVTGNFNYVLTGYAISH